MDDREPLRGIVVSDEGLELPGDPAVVAEDCVLIGPPPTYNLQNRGEMCIMYFWLQ